MYDFTGSKNLNGFTKCMVPLSLCLFITCMDLEVVRSGYMRPLLHFCVVLPVQIEKEKVVWLCKITFITTVQWVS